MSRDDSDDGDAARRDRLLALLTAPDTSPDTSPDADTVGPGGGRDRLGRVCALAVSEVVVSGAGVTVMAGPSGGQAGDRDQVWSTGALTRRLEGLQLTTGQGPCLDAFGDGAPVLVGDLGAEPGRWIGFGPEALAVGAAAVFSLPLQVGAIRLGTLDLHRDTIGALSRPQLADALILAGLATEILLDLADADPPSADETDDSPGAGADTLGWLPGVHAEVHQASGMVSAREHIGVDAALLRIRGYAYAHGEPIEQVARRILERTLTLDEHRADEPDIIPDNHPDLDTDHNPDNGPAGPPRP